ncbi:hypothetical protein [Sphingomonas sp. BK235]|uniref:hypothetical protein n=1 Tax=Sphingomonas sp. BK235 TaxID=2512131 RepID=UPI001052700C|nr:hypothetical protein [Sphingomonas sp. BK235]TCP34903.1 hypothetical protein EV292_103330 [Sphingomonas sp. BK235]
MVALAAASMLVAAAAYDPVTALAGRYSQHFRNGLMDGTSYWSDDVVEVVPVDPTHAYLRIETNFFNGQSCSLAGVAVSERDALVYREPDHFHDGKRCVLTMRREGGRLRFDDGENSCTQHCGVRGSLSRGELPWKSRRPITYLARLRSSEEYRDALAEWRGMDTQQ